MILQSGARRIATIASSALACSLKRTVKANDDSLVRITKAEARRKKDETRFVAVRRLIIIRQQATATDARRQLDI
jgi:hypothetical protein